MESRKFEDSLKAAFDGAEVSPSDIVWTNIELDLEKAEGGKIKRSLVFYKMLAAASVVFALGVAGVGYYMIGHQHQQDIVINTDVKNNNSDDAATKPATARPLEVVIDHENVARRAEQSRAEHAGGVQVGEEGKADAVQLQKRLPTRSNGFVANVDSQHAVLKPSRNQFSGSALFSFSAAPAREDAARKLPELYDSKHPVLTISTVKPDAGALLLAQRAKEEMEYAAIDKKESRDKTERIWTSVGFAAGGFSAIHSSVSQSTANSLLSSNSSTIPDKQAKASGVAYSFGINIGAKLSKRWILQGGFNYLTQSSDYIATNVVGDNNFGALRAESIYELDKLQSADLNASGRLAPTFPYSVNNSVQFFSLPMQAGYLVVNKKFGLQLNAGVSTDLFLQNTLTPEGESLDRTTQGSGADSPYRSVNFSGLMGTELSYRFGTRYRVALNPGLRYPLNSIYKADIGIQSTPLTFDVGLRFRYIFQ